METLLICVENTGVYSEALFCELGRRRFNLVLLDPHAVWKINCDCRTDELDNQKSPSTVNDTAISLTCGNFMRPWRAE